MTHRRKRVGYGLVAVAIALMIVGESVASMASLIATFSAMLVGGIGLYLAFDDQA